MRVNQVPGTLLLNVEGSVATTLQHEGEHNEGRSAGSGIVAQILTRGLLKHGKAAMVGTRTLAKLDDWAKQNPGTQIGAFDQAAAFGEVLILAVKRKAAPDVHRLASAANIAGKTIMDACDPIFYRLNHSLIH